MTMTLNTTMHFPAFTQACLESRRLTSLSEYLQDLMEDRKAEMERVSSLSVLEIQSDLMLSVVSWIHLAGSRIVELLGRDFAQTPSEDRSSGATPDIVAAMKDMLMAVTAVSQACDQLHQSSFTLGSRLPDFALLAQQSSDLMQQLQNAIPNQRSRTG